MMKKKLKIVTLLLLVLLVLACKKENEHYNDMQRHQFERLVFNKPKVSDHEIVTLNNLRDTGADFAYFRELPDIRGYISGGEGNLFLVNFIVAYNFKNRKLGLELSKKRW